MNDEQVNDEVKDESNDGGSNVTIEELAKQLSEMKAENEKLKADLEDEKQARKDDVCKILKGFKAEPQKSKEEQRIAEIIENINKTRR